MHIYLFLILTTLSWSANTIFAILAADQVSPMVIVCARWLGVSLLVSIFAYKHLLNDREVIKENIRYFILMGMSGFALFNGLYYIAAHTTTAINLGILQGSIPIFVLIGSVFYYHTRLKSIQILGISLTLIGVILVTVKGDLNILLGLEILRGDLLMFIACLLYAAYTLGLKKRPKIHSMSLFAMFAFVAFLTSVPMLITEYQLGYTQMPTPKGWVIIGLITLFPSFLSQILYIHSVEAIGPTRAGLFVNLIPIFSAILAVIFLNEHFQWYHLAALGLVLGGIALSEYFKD